MERTAARLRETLSGLWDPAELRRIASEVLKRESPVRVSGLGGPMRGLFAARMWSEFRRPLVIVASDPSETDRLRTDTVYFHQQLNERGADRVSAFPAWDNDPYSGLGTHADVERTRASTLWRLRSEAADIVVTSARALASRLPEPADFDTCGLGIDAGDELSQELMLDHLERAGYVRQEPVSTVGEYSRRGGIVDVFSPLAPYPARIEFFGDSVDSIRRFDPDDQRSIGPLRHIDVLPMRERIVSGPIIRQWAAQARRRWRDERHQDELRARLALADDGAPFEGWPFLIPAAAPLTAGLTDYLDAGVLVVDEPGVLFEAYGRYFDVLAERYAQTDRAGGLALPPDSLFRPPDELRSLVEARCSLRLEELGAAGEEFHVISQPARRFHGRMREMVETVRASWEAGRQVVLLGSTNGMAERLRDILREYEVPFRTEFGESDPSPKPAAGRAPLIAVGRVSEGFRLPDIGVEVFAETDILDESEHFVGPARRPSATAAFLSDLEDLKIGAYVVHVDHGIGRYEGVATIHDRECLRLSYENGDALYVPLERLDLVRKYASREGAHPKPDRLGGTTWAQRKARVRRAIRDMAEELLQLYAERRVAVGHAYPPDSAWQKEFDDAFPYEPTDDQLAAIADIKRDMEAPAPMDRLVCGDVGYGKTEVAMRAAFKAVDAGKQVAVLAPTTVLCFQHFETLKERFAAFPVTIAMLSRFVPPKERTQVVADAGSGKVDILVGTHRLLSKDVEFRDLGLLVIDEEQRFGVAHKERLKRIRKQVDVITMTATPIPRTLHMALTGLRDMSVIETPPRDRLAIRTSVLEFNPIVVENAIEEELERAGQVYFVHNRVGSIYSMASYIQKICPRARVEVGHGQMSERELERVMLRFMRHEFDVLVATTIIENGLDIPLANTMLINRADRYGLAELYQLRGRVGRSNRRAYAYLLIASDKTLTPIARRRLAAIREFSELGAGFRIAALDLELRGAGNLLGGQQHGHIEAIGFDLYCQMLERTIEEVRTGEAPPEVETSINLKSDLKIPPDFVADEALRLRIYRGIASCRTEADVDSRYRDLEDRLGRLPSPVENLLEYARLRVLGRALGARSIDRKRDRVEIAFAPEARIEPERIVQLVERNPDVGFMPPATLHVSAAEGAGRVFDRIRTVLRELT